MTAETSTASLIKEAKAFHLKKRLGQHFLVDVDALAGIVSALGAQEGDTVIEVGPGIGFLTRMLVPTGAKIIAVDLDRESVERLQNNGYKNVEIKHGDILQFDLNTMDFPRRGDPRSGLGGAGAERQRPSPVTSRLKVVGNVPYQITGLIIGHLLGELDQPSPWLHRIENIVLTVQYEVAQRIVAKAGDKEYSRVSILVGQYCEAELAQRIPAESFFPPPKVGSAVVRLIPRAQPLISCKNMSLLRKLVAAGFRERRKMFRNALGFLRLPQSEVDGVFARIGIDPQVRAERLSLKQFAMLADAFDGYSNQADGKTDSNRSGEDKSDL